MKKQYFSPTNDPLVNLETDENYEIDKEALFNNSAPRLPVVLLVDCSGSMGFKNYSGIVSPIDEVNKGIKGMLNYLQNDYDASKRVELAVVAFSSETRVVSDFTPIANKVIPELTAGGKTYMVPAIKLALDMIEERKRELRSHGRSLYRPIVILLTDGGPTESDSVFNEWKKKVYQNTIDKHLQFFAVKIGYESDKELDAKHAKKLEGFDCKVPAGRLDLSDFSKFFVWLSNSIQTRSKSGNIGDSSIADPTDWWKKL